MPVPIGAGSGDSSYMGDMPGEFEFPDISNMSWEQKQELYYRYQRHVGTTDRDNCDVNPSEVIDPGDPESMNRAAERQMERTTYDPSLDEENDQCRENSRHEFDPDFGYVVGPGEDLGRLAGRLSPEALEQLARKAGIRPGRLPSEQEMYRHRINKMSEPERDAEERFGDLI